MNVLLRIKNNKFFKQSSFRKTLLKMMPRNSVCAEVGTWKGEFSKQILEIAKPRKLYLIDPY
ncbi:MAG: hypothetical protein GXO79_04285 [Chlorobi bacterium]|nr:hypothetical protein [Chlorobiota bacterium]